MNAVIYARYSSDNQREESIDAQLRICRRHCEERGYKIVREYVDEAFTATNDRRPSYQQMIADSKSGQFQVVVFHKVNRNARNEYDYYFNKMKLIRAGVSVEYAGQAFDSQTPEGQLMENQLVGMAAYFSRNLSKEVKKGQHENALKCVHNGGTPPLGYDVGKDMRYVINEAEARAVRLIFDMYTNDYKYNDIIAELNRQGYRTKIGREFRNNSIHDILVNPKYAGYYVYGRHRGPRNQPRNSHKASDDAYIVKGGMPAIVEEEVWNKAAARLSGKRRYRASYSAKTVFLLAGLIRCRNCGHNMTGTAYRQKLKSGVKEYAYYRCQHCGSKQVHARPLESLVVDTIRRVILNPKRVEAITDSINNQLQKNTLTYSAELNDLQRTIKTLEGNNDRLMGLLETGEINDIVIARVKSNSIKISSARQRLNELREYSQELLSPKRVRAVINAWKELEDDDSLQAMVRTFTRAVIVGDGVADIDLCLSIDASEYSASNLHQSVTLLE